MSTTALAIIEPSEVIDIEPAGSPAPDPWGKARRYVEAATLFQRASLASQIMAGVELATLKKAFPETRGQFAAKKKPHGAVFTPDRTWAEAVKYYLGISPDTASRWMEMAKVAKARLSSGDLNLAAILEKNPGALTPAEQELLKAAVHKISDGHTQMEFLDMCGGIKRGQGSGARGGDTRAAALANAAEGHTEAGAAAVVDGWEPRAKHLNGLVIEALGDGWWNECSEAQRRELHGNLIDAAARVAATLKK